MREVRIALDNIGTRTHQKMRFDAGLHGFTLSENTSGNKPVSLTPRQKQILDTALSDTLARKRAEARLNG
ncbi:MAG: hypothetical protein A2428_03125 [Bdellovibrionales bacterium RIFOXYC1_FULL_54_43]|nr:MAG: hypothetical protein A2428_03125 [Bdellovibrionales bacterium RIFOXYC1_FULL_54_43]OFZ82673.1 MAG: hypothetical protein A2603_02560 [Bdellovibrionales bacterium RIFOXYD1_FULL_55_31]